MANTGTKVRTEFGDYVHFVARRNGMRSMRSVPRKTREYNARAAPSSVAPFYPLGGASSAGVLAGHGKVTSHFAYTVARKCGGDCCDKSGGLGTQGWKSSANKEN